MSVLLENRPQHGQVISNLPRPERNAMPHWVKLLPDGNVEVPMQRAINRPILNLKSGIRFLELPDVNLDAF